MVRALSVACASRGETETIWVAFEVKNRGDSITHLGNAQLRESGVEGSTETLHQAFRHESTAPRYSESAHGIALVTAPEGQPKPSAWEFVLEEDGGKNGTVVVGELDF